MSVGKIGGLLAIVSGALVIMGILIYLTIFSAPLMEGYMLPSLLVAILVIVGGILGMIGKKWAGILPLAGGIVWLLGMLLYIFADLDLVFVVSYIMLMAKVFYNFLYLGGIEVLLAIIGGILILMNSK